MGHGFPFLLPYIDFLPDHYSAGYGLGGGKIVTVVGFFGLLVEVFGKSPETGRGANARILHGLVAGINFLAPSYILGIVAGFVAKIGRASGRERVFQYVSIWVVAV